MSCLSELLRTYISNCKISIVNLSTTTGIDRTLIQKVLSGDRIPSLEFIENIAFGLHLTPIERNELTKCYYITKDGEEVYKRRELIKSIIQELTESSQTTEEQVDNQYSLFDLPSDTKVLKCSYDVNASIKNILRNEIRLGSSKFIYMLIQPDYKYLIDMLMSLSPNDKSSLKIIHMFSFNKNITNDADRTENLENFKAVLPLILCINKDYNKFYRAYYFYSSLSNESRLMSVMPYIIATEHYAITISHDYQKAIIFSDKDTVNYFRNECIRIKNLTYQLITDELKSAFMSNIYLLDVYSNKPTIVLKQDPYIVHIVPDQLIESKLNLNIINKENMFNKNNKLTTLFTLKGLDEFIRTGILSDLSTNYFQPFSKQEIIYILKELKSASINDTNNFQIIDSNKLYIPDNIVISINMGNELTMIFKTNQTPHYYFLNIIEPSIVDAFTEYLEYIKTTNLLLDKKEVASELEKRIEKLIS